MTSSHARAKVLEPVDFGAGRKEPGEIVDLPAALLEGLAAAGVVEPAAPRAAAREETAPAAPARRGKGA